MEVGDGVAVAVAVAVGLGVAVGEGGTSVAVAVGAMVGRAGAVLVGVGGDGVAVGVSSTGGGGGGSVEGGVSSVGGGTGVRVGTVWRCGDCPGAAQRSGPATSPNASKLRSTSPETNLFIAPPNLRTKNDADFTDCGTPALSVKSALYSLRKRRKNSRSRSSRVS